jgi:hypothetical protein
MPEFLFVSLLLLLLIPLGIGIYIEQFVKDDIGRGDA